MTIFNHVIASESGKDFKAYVAYPPQGSGPGLILLHEVYGVNDNLKSVADDYAAQGFVVYCPNVYWRHNPDASFHPQSPGEPMSDAIAHDRDAARDLMYNKLDYGRVIDDVKIAADALRADPACTGKVGAMGFCLGGRNTYLAAVRGIVDAGVVFYPTPALKDVFSIAEAEKTATPLMFVLGGQDPYITADEKEAMVGVSAHTTYYVPGLTAPLGVDNSNGNPNISTLYFSANGHAFGRIGGKDYDSAAASQAYGVASGFLGEKLGLRTGTAPDLLKTPASPAYLPQPKK